MAFREAAPSGRKRPPAIFTARSLKSFYWNVAKDPRCIAGLALALCRAPISAVRFFFVVECARDRRPVMAIALVEHIGDIVAAEPIARFARRSYPDWRILWITRKPYAALAGAFPDVDEVFVVSCVTEWALLWRLGLVRVVWDLHLDARTCPRCGLPILKSDSLPNLDNYYHRGNLLAVQCDSAELPRLAEAPILSPPAAVAATIDRLRLPPSFVVIHCSANDPLRDWRADCWRELVDRIAAETGLPVIEVGTKPLLSWPDGGLVRNLCGRLSILETAEAIRRARLFVGVDSGPAHLANAVGTPGVILLGKYMNFERYLPFSGRYADGSNAELLYAEGPARTLTANEVFAAVSRQLAKRGLHG